jgi:leucyl-tRNA synthetase
MHETYNFLNKIIEKQFKKEILSENYKKILTVMSPIVPHIIHECLENLNFDVLQKWPTINKKMLDNESVIIVIQINGKKKGTIKIKKDVEEKTIMEQIKKDDKMRKNFENKKISKIFFVKNRLINILLK